MRHVFEIYVYISVYAYEVRTELEWKKTFRDRITVLENDLERTQCSIRREIPDMIYL